MPGKYSHSVVLADYSSRGIINLPADQHIKYTASSPQLLSRPSSQARARGTRSAQAAPYLSRSEGSSWRASTADQPHPSLLTAIATTRTRLQVPQEDEVTTFQPMRYSQYYRQLPNSSPNLNVTSSVSHKEAPPVPSLPQAPTKSAVLSAYQRQQLFNASTRLNPGEAQIQTNGIGRQPASPTSEASEDPWSLPVVPRYAKSTSSFRKAPPESTEATPQRRISHRTPIEVPIVDYVVDRANPLDRSRSELDATKISSPTLSDPPAYDEVLGNANLPNPSITSHSEKQSNRYEANDYGVTISPPPRNPSRLGQTGLLHETQISQARPLQRVSNATIGRDFNGFLDREASSNGNGLSFAGFTPQDLISRNAERYVPVLVSSTRTGSTRDVSTGVAKLSTAISSNDHRARSSSSSAKAANNFAISSAAKTSSPSKNSHTAPSTERQSQIDHQSWQLPEIKEHQDFTPSIFEARLSQDDSKNVTRDDIERSIGQISSGKDVTFDDAASELSAALPPPISRFRDEEDEFNSNMAKLFGEGGDLAITKKGSHTFGKSSKKRGFFAKFRSKS